MLISPSEAFVTIYHLDMPAARHFYEDALGLKLRELTCEWFVGYWVSPRHEMTLSSSSREECARWGAGDRGVVIDFVVADVDAVYTEFKAQGAEFTEPPTDMPWGLRTATLLDPAGYTPTITSHLPGGRRDKGEQRSEA